jgi:hypothetical protein
LALSRTSFYTSLRVDLPGLPHELLVAAAWLAALVALVQTLRLAGSRWWRRRRLALSRERGAAGELRAEAMLRDLGFAILGRQVPGGYSLGVDGALIAVDVRADYVVAARGRRYVAEVKTGVFAPRLETAATRRQLLEYRIAFAALDIDGVLLVDADTKSVRLVEFPLPAPPPDRAWVLWLSLGAAAGALVTLASALAFSTAAR